MRLNVHETNKVLKNLTFLDGTKVIQIGYRILETAPPCYFLFPIILQKFKEALYVSFNHHDIFGGGIKTQIILS